MVVDVMSLVPKITEVQEFIDRNKVSLAFVTETWLKSAVVDTVVDVPGFSIVWTGHPVHTVAFVLYQGRLL